MEKIFIYDLETTGLNPGQHGIHQISGMIIIDGIVKERFDFKVRPFDSDEIEQAALDIAGVTKEQIMKYPTAVDVYSQLQRMLRKYINKFNSKDKMHLMGFNNRKFDDLHFREWFTKNGDKYFGSWFWSDSIDVMVLASYHLRGVRNLMTDFKLKTVASTMGIVIDEMKLHDAMYDIELTHTILKAIEAQMLSEYESKLNSK